LYACAGGGDGGILFELLKLKPAEAVMLELDKVNSVLSTPIVVPFRDLTPSSFVARVQNVIDAAVKHLRGICGDAMDQLKGDNYEVRLSRQLRAGSPFRKRSMADATFNH
jgi:spermine synthase